MAWQHDPLDIVTIGRSCVDLYGAQVGGRLEDMMSFAKYIGGSPTNTAVGAARLGLRSAVLTRVGADHFGRFIREQLEREQVCTQGVVTDAERLTALVFLGIRDSDTFPLIFYRENCADMALTADDIDIDLVSRAAAVLINGTHLSSPGVFDACVRACRAARNAGAKVVFDVDYRPVLWGLAGKDMGENRFVADAAVTARLQEVLPLCDLVVGTEEEMHILGGETDTLTALRTIRGKSDALLVCKRGALGCVAFPGDMPASLDKGVVGRGFAIEVFNVLGAGDAFMAGFLRGWLRGESLETACEYGNACGAIVVSRHGCAPAMPSMAELRQFLDSPQHPFRLRDDAMLEHIHRATTRPRIDGDLTILAVDHRSQFEELIRATGADASRIAAFKLLAFRAVDALGKGATGFGILLDGRYGVRGLEAAADRAYWIGRPIEAAGSRPLAFDSSPDVATELATWPYNHVVKCLVACHPTDPEDMRVRQERQLLRLQDACRKTCHELLIEVITSRNGDVDEHTVASVLQHFYDLGLRPDWWKLEPARDASTWVEIERVVRKGDPWCRGVLLLGLNAPAAELIDSFRAVSNCSIVRGFAVGRTIFADVAERWLRGTIDDDAAIDELSARFAELVHAWHRIRGEQVRTAAGR